MRTLRIPERGVHHLPPGLGTFPLRRVADFPSTTPARWRHHSGLILPIYRREALWLLFSADEPAALRVGIGRVCAVSGKAWGERMSRRPQNYVVLPEQPWLDGINAGNGLIRQFVAAPQGSGTEAGQPSARTERFGCVRLEVFRLTERARAAWRKQHAGDYRFLHDNGERAGLSRGGASPARAGLEAGGRLRQEVYKDPRQLATTRRASPGRPASVCCRRGSGTRSRVSRRRPPRSTPRPTRPPDYRGSTPTPPTPPS